LGRSFIGNLLGSNCRVVDTNREVFKSIHGGNALLDRRAHRSCRVQTHIENFAGTGCTDRRLGASTPHRGGCGNVRVGSELSVFNIGRECLDLADSGHSRMALDPAIFRQRRTLSEPVMRGGLAYCSLDARYEALGAVCPHRAPEQLD